MMAIKHNKKLYMHRLQGHTPGFTFTEVLIAMAIVGILMTPVLILQNNVLQATGFWSLYIQRLLEADQLLVQVQIDERVRESGVQEVQSRSTVQVLYPPTTLNYQSLPVPDNSAVKSFKHMRMECVEMRWQEAGRARTDTVISFLYKPDKAAESA